MPRGRFTHPGIAKAASMRGECAVGWFAHYIIGAIYGLMLVAVVPTLWLERPTLWPALGFGIVTVAMPFLIMQPAFGLGVAASKAPNPGQTRLRSLMTHAVFGAGLYVSAVILG